MVNKQQQTTTTATATMMVMKLWESSWHTLDLFFASSLGDRIVAQRSFLCYDSAVVALRAAYNMETDERAHEEGAAVAVLLGFDLVSSLSRALLLSQDAVPLLRRLGHSVFPKVYSHPLERNGFVEFLLFFLSYFVLSLPFEKCNISLPFTWVSGGFLVAKLCLSLGSIFLCLGC